MFSKHIRYCLLYFVILFLCILISPNLFSESTEYSSGTNDVVITVDTTGDNEGRVTGLEVGGEEIGFCDDNGGFYIRDYTVDTTGLPDDLDSFGNLLSNYEFDNDLTGWTATGLADGYDIDVIEIQVSSSATTDSAEIHIHEDDEGAWATLFQDIDFSDNAYSTDTTYETPTEHDLFCLSFDVATECGYRSQSNPYGNNNYTFKHRIAGMIEWYDSTGMPTYPDRLVDDDALAATTMYCYESTNSFVDDPTNPYMQRTTYGCRSYRPLNAAYARVRIQVEGFMPNDDTNYNAVYFDNVAFYRAPPIRPVKAVGLLDGSTPGTLTDLDGNSLPNSLDMWATVTEVDTVLQNKHYLLIEGELINEDDDAQNDLPARVLDLGFAFPIDEDEGTQEIEWWDDGLHSEFIADSPQVLPFRAAGPIDTRPRIVSNYFMYDEFYDDEPHNVFSKEVQRLRAESTQISAYPFSSINIHTSSSQPSLAFGDNLGADCVNISHYGYRVLQPEQTGSPTVPFRGMYYVEFRIGIREEEDSNGDNTTPFSFIIFRSDDPSWDEPSSFREASEEYQTTIFESFFERPTNTEDTWLYGGGQYQPDYTIIEGILALDDDGFNDTPTDFGYRYHERRYDANMSISRAIGYADLISDLGIGMVTYRAPWRAQFVNDNSNTDMNHYDRLESSASDFDPGDYGWGEIWSDLHAESLANYVSLPNDVYMYSKTIHSIDQAEQDREMYYFPVLIADSPLGGGDLLSEEINYVKQAYTQLSDETENGFRGTMFDVVFDGTGSANQLDMTSDWFDNYIDQSGILTYSINHLTPAIPQLATNVWFLDEIDDTLSFIDNSTSLHGDSDSGDNVEDEVIIGNVNEHMYGGSKYAIMKGGVFGFESNAGTASNSSAKAQYFRRSLARDKNMARLLTLVPCVKDVLVMWKADGCSRCKEFWNGYDDFRLQIINEAAWMSLAWGFLPNIPKILPTDWPSEQEFDEFIDDHVRDLFTFDPADPPGLGFTDIFKELHLAGWRPITNADPHDGTNPVELFVERFGDSADYPGTGEYLYFTVLNNEKLSLTFVNLSDTGATSPYAEKSVHEIFYDHEIADYNVCADDFANEDFPEDCTEANFEIYEKEYFLDIYNPDDFDLLDGNIHGIQLVSNDDSSGTCNWPEIEACAFGEGAGNGTSYTIRRINTDEAVRIGGIWALMSNQMKVTIEDKALMVFKLWTTTLVDGGEEQGSGESEESEDRDSGGSSDFVSSTYERYGQGWQTYDTAGHNGSVEATTVGSRGTALYKVNIAKGGEYDVKVYFPTSYAATVNANYDVFIMEYQEEPIGNGSLGTPDLSVSVDQTDTNSYEAAEDAYGFINIGTIDVNIREGGEAATVVIKLSAGEDDSDALLVSDAIYLERVE